MLFRSNGTVQWRLPDGAPNGELVPGVPGSGEGLRFDAAGNLYVTHWCADNTCSAGNTVEKFNVNGVSEGTVGSGYNCNPHALTFDAAGNLYVTHWCTDPTCTIGNTVETFNVNGMSQGTVGSGYNCNPHALAFDAAGSLFVGQADCTGAILKLSPGEPPVAFAVAAENRGSFWIDIAGDGCTVFYTSWGPNVKRFDVCTNTQLADFNLAPLPGGATQGLRLLPDGGVLVASSAVVARLDATGALVQTYSVSTGEDQFWAGLDLVGDGTFWAVNYYASNVYKFDLTTGAVLASFNTGTPPATAVDVRVSR